MIMKKMKMLAVSGVVLGAGAMLCAANTKSVTVPAPEAKAAANDLLAQMNQPQGVSVSKAFDFLPAVVAKVNGKDITKAEFIDAMAKQVPGGIIPPQMPVDMLKVQAPQLVEQYVTTQVLDQALADSKITVSADEVAAKLKAEIAKMPREQRSMIEQMLKAQGKTIDDVIKEQAANKDARKRSEEHTV